MKRKQSGQSLVEVLFGIFLAGLCATVLAATMPVANNSREMANYQNVAISIAQKHMEGLRGQGYPNLTPDRMFSNGMIDSATAVSANRYSFHNSDQGNHSSPAMQLPSGQGFLTVEQTGIDLRRVLIEIRWVERGRNKSVTLGTTVANL